jgi:hypothetical protein
MLGGVGGNGDYGGNAQSLDNMNLDRGDHGNGGFYDPLNSNNVRSKTLITKFLTYFFNYRNWILNSKDRMPICIRSRQSEERCGPLKCQQTSHNRS